MLRCYEESLRSKYKVRLRQIWRSQLAGENKVAELRIFLLSSFGALKWNVTKLQALDRKTRKIMNINRSLHPQFSVQRI